MSGEDRLKADNGGGADEDEREGAAEKEGLCKGCGRKGKRLPFFRLRKSKKLLHQKRKQKGICVNSRGGGRRGDGGGGGGWCCLCLRQPKTLDSSVPRSDTCKYSHAVMVIGSFHVCTVQSDQRGIGWFPIGALPGYKVSKGGSLHGNLYLSPQHIGHIYFSSKKAVCQEPGKCAINYFEQRQASIKVLVGFKLESAGQRRGLRLKFYYDCSLHMSYLMQLISSIMHDEYRNRIQFPLCILLLWFRPHSMEYTYNLVKIHAGIRQVTSLFPMPEIKPDTFC